jgi:seryl-tRNA synthetase
MLQLHFLREKTEEAIERLSKRNIDARSLVNEVLELDAMRRECQVRRDQISARSNQMAKAIGQMMKGGYPEKASLLKLESSQLKEEVQLLDKQLSDIEQKQTQLLYQIPNAPHHSVSAGKSSEDNEVVVQKGNIPAFSFTPLPHWDLAKKYDLIDFELGVKITGAGFPVYKGKGARLQRALINFFLDKATSAGYIEHQPPHLVNEASGFGTGQLPDKEGQMYHVTLDQFYLIPTAEVPLTNIFRDVVLRDEELPVKLCGYTPCFRREAGSYGKDVRGLNRLHQFDKVEIVQLQHPEKSYQALEVMCAHVMGLLELLELPYRRLKLCGGDMGFASALTYDMEVYSAAQQRWLEVSSISNFETFQSNRMKARFKEGNGKPQFVHTLNGSALALPRIVAALLENNQTPQGIKIPSELAVYTGFDMIGTV